MASLAAFGVTALSEAVLHQPAQVGFVALCLGLVSGAPKREKAAFSAASRVRWSTADPVFWSGLVLALLGSGLCAARQYGAERHLGAALQVERPSSRLARLEKAQRWACDPGQVQFQKALLLDRLGRRGEALALMRRALARRPDALRLLAMGNILFGMGRLQGAVAAYEKAIEMHPRLAAGYFNLGLALEAQGRSERAKRMLLRAHSLLPGRYPRPR